MVWLDLIHSFNGISTLYGLFNAEIRLISFFIIIIGEKTREKKKRRERKVKKRQRQTKKEREQKQEQESKR